MRRTWRSSPRTLQHNATHCNTLQHTATQKNEENVHHLLLFHTHPPLPSASLEEVRLLNGLAVCCNVLQSVAHTATDCNRLQQTATDYSTHPPLPAVLLARAVEQPHGRPDVTQASHVNVSYIPKDTATDYSRVKSSEGTAGFYRRPATH